jgi:hypothetical protein
MRVTRSKCPSWSLNRAALSCGSNPAVLFDPTSIRHGVSARHGMATSFLAKTGGWVFVDPYKFFGKDEEKRWAKPLASRGSRKSPCSKAACCTAILGGWSLAGGTWQCGCRTCYVRHLGRVFYLMVSVVTCV